MSKTQKELAFLRDLYVAEDWTVRFTDIFDANLKFSGEKSILYVNAGTGNHALAVSEKLEQDSNLNAFNEDEELNIIAQAKANALKSDVFFASVFPDESFDVVLADASFVELKNLYSFVAEIIDLSDKQVAFFLPTAGSFGEIFSFLWETLFDLDLLEKGTEVERLIAEIPTVSKIKEMVKNLGLSKLEVVTKNEIFEFENGAEFAASPLVADFFLPVWLDFLDEQEQKRVSERLAQIIDADDGTLSFHFSIKATLVVGEKS
ncbi:MAG: hypothetical protein ABI686_02390 [Acidobacteriota bacterium]